LFVGSRVRITDGSNTTGEIVDDFGDLAGPEVTIDEHRTARARRWAVALDDGGIAFLDDDALEPIDHRHGKRSFRNGAAPCFRRSQACAGLVFAATSRMCLLLDEFFGYHSDFQGGMMRQYPPALTSPDTFRICNHRR
jgi:hypothetical protein